jgi:hypothetical protein
MHGGGVTGHGHVQHVVNHDVPPYFDPLCSDSAPSDFLESLLPAHGQLKKHVPFYLTWQVKTGSPDLKKNFQQSVMSVLEITGKT